MIGDEVMDAYISTILKCSGLFRRGCYKSCYSVNIAHDHIPDESQPWISRSHGSNKWSNGYNKVYLGGTRLHRYAAE